MAFTKMGAFSFNHSGQPETLPYAAADAQEKFDSRASELKTALNNAIDLLNATADGNSGADNVGATAIDGVTGTTVQAQMESMKGLVDGKAASGHNHTGTYAPVSHSHAISDVTNLQTSLDGKVDESLLTTQGDIAYATGASTWARLAKGTAGQVLTMNSGATAPEWADASSGGAQIWTTVSSFTRVSDSSYAVTDNADNQAIHAKGRPIRYKATGGSYVYGIITNYATGTVTLAGAPMTTSYDDVLEYGDFTRVVPLEVMIPSSFAATGASSTLINTVLKSDLAWRMGKAYLVLFSVIVDTDDSGAAQTRVNVNIAGSAVSTSNTNAGVAIAETWQSTTTDINTSNYDIAFGDAIEFTCDANGTNDDAKDLTVSMVFVLE